MLAKTNLFLVSGVAHRLRGTYHLKKLGGLYRVSPGLSVLFLISAFALAGMPPLSGFWSKLMLVKAGLDIEHFAIVAAALVVSILTTYSMTKIWNEVFWKEAPSGNPGTQTDPLPDESPAPRFLLVLPIVILAGLILVIGIVANPFVDLIMKAATQLMNPAEYISSVSGSIP
jgi:multicomponent Na+:H+ antiporter subunit D